MKNEKKNNISLSDEDLLRYNKHILLDEIGIYDIIVSLGKDEVKKRLGNKIFA